VTGALARVRSLLFVPGDDEAKLRKAGASGADVVIADLEDGVAPNSKPRARDTIARVFAEPAGDTLRAVRVCALGTKDAQADLALAARVGVDVVVVPKAEPAGVALLDGNVPLIALVETGADLRSAYELARAPAVAALMLGPADLSADLGLEPRPDGLELLHARSTLVIDSAAAGIAPPIDGPRLDFRAEEALRAEVALVRALGFGAKACIHPAQVAVVNAGFTPSADEVEAAARIVAAHERARGGVVALDGTMVDGPVVARALRTIARVGPERAR
jgi:citrate lyase subunit beta/citryl-CoA lyase